MAGTWGQRFGVWEKGAARPLEEVGQEAVVLWQVLPCLARLATPAPGLEAKIRWGDSGLGWAVGAQTQPHSEWPHSGEWHRGWGAVRERVEKGLPQSHRVEARQASERHLASAASEKDTAKRRA